MSSIGIGFARRRILAIGAHPDDTFLGAGGYLIQLRSCGHEVNILTISSGSLAGDGKCREYEEVNAARICDFRVDFAGLDDGLITFPSAMNCIESAVDRIAPDLVLTHAPNDTHQDHRIVADATMAACRMVPSLYYYEGPSSVSFNPTMTIDCSTTWQVKLAALECYVSQMRRKPYIAWADAVSGYRAWPRHIGSPCEAFCTVRHDPQTYPRSGSDLLSELITHETGAKVQMHAGAN